MIAIPLSPIRNARTIGLGLLAWMTAALAGGPSQAPAVTINLTLAANTANPSFDPSPSAASSELMDIAQAAAAYWEGIIRDNVVVDITIGYQDLGSATYGYGQVDTHDIMGRPTAGSIAIDTHWQDGTERTYYFDPTPTTNTEFAMQQVLVRDLQVSTRNLYYDSATPPPGLLEVGFHGDYTGANPGRDMYSLVLHEIGHILGLSEGLPAHAAQVMDGDFDLESDFLAGNEAAAKVFDGGDPEGRAHVRASDAAMTVGGGNGDRNLPGATDILAMASVAGWTNLDLPRVDYLGVDDPVIGDVWNFGVNWVGGQVPDADGDVFVRHGGVVGLFVDSQAGNLFIREGSGVETNAETLDVTGRITVESAGGGTATLIVEPDALVLANELRINEGGAVSVSSGDAVVFAHRVRANSIDINEGGTLAGHGAVAGEIQFRNDGIISAVSPLADPTRALWLVHTAVDGTIDLDGASGEGQVFAILGDLRVFSPLSDDFDGQLTIGAGRTATFNAPWTLGSDALDGGRVSFQGGASVATEATLDGGDWTVHHGQVDVEGVARILANATVDDDAIIDVAQNGLLVFAGETTVRGGEFRTASPSFTDGNVRFDGETQWNGAVVVDGALRQNGNATVAGVTSIDAGVLDMDGSHGMTAWSIQNNTNITAQSIDTIISNTFNGRIDVVGGFFPRLNVNLVGSFAEWNMAGEMNLAGDNNFFITRIGGTRMRVTGELNLTGGRSQIDADLTLAAGSTIDFESAATNLRTIQETRIEAGATFVGAGALTNGPTGHMLIANGASLADIELVNHGLLDVGDSPGVATVGRFENGADGVWRVEIGGYAPGDKHDLLQVFSDNARLGGNIQVDLIDAGDGLFLPQIGDQFVILTTISDVEGVFLSDPVTSAAGHLYHWSVDYQPDFVVLELVNVTVPEPASAALLAIGLAVGTCLRRRKMRVASGV